VIFFWDSHHLTVGSPYKKDFYDWRTAAVAGVLVLPNQVLALPNQVTSDVCETLSHWDAAHSFMLSARIMIPVAPSAYDEVEPEDGFNSAEISDEAHDSEPVHRVDTSVGRRCRAIQPGWNWKGRELALIHSWNPVVVALFIKVLSNLLLTLFGATIATQLSRKPG
jgi:hypothetical protein